MKMFFENWLWKLILCVFPVTKAGGWSCNLIFLRSPSSDSVLLSLFPKNPCISAPRLNWGFVSAAQFLLACLEAVVSGFLVIHVCSSLVLLTIVVSHACLMVSSLKQILMCCDEFNIFSRWVIEYRKSLVFREREVNGRALKVTRVLLFSCKNGTREGRETQLVFHWKSTHFLFIVHQSTQ